jgi:hypothetical protein
MVRNMSIVVIDSDGNERAVHRVTYGSKLHVDEGDAVKRGQRIAEWDPYTRPMLAEVDGVVDFEDLVDGLLFRKGRRGNRYHQACRHRLAFFAAWRGSQAGDCDQGRQRASSKNAARMAMPA